MESAESADNKSLSDGLGKTAPIDPPIDFKEDDQFRHSGYWNSFQFDPPLRHEDALLVSNRATEVGYRMTFRRPDFSLEEVQRLLLERGPSYFLNLRWLEEDISPKEPLPAAEERMAARLRMLAPIQELVVTDPYLFTRARKNDAEEYAKSVGRMMAPVLLDGLHIKAVVNSQAHAAVQMAVETELHRCADGLKITVVRSDDFHDRFWIADGKRGLIIGTSLNKIGNKIFFVDELSESDVDDVLSAVGDLSLL